MDWTLYDDHGKGWNLEQGGEPSPQHFARGVINGGAFDVLAISSDGVSSGLGGARQPGVGRPGGAHPRRSAGVRPGTTVSFK